MLFFGFSPRNLQKKLLIFDIPIFQVELQYLFPIYLILFVVFFIIVLLVVVIIVVVIVDWPELVGRYITIDKRMLLLKHPRLSNVFVIVELQN